MLTNGHEYTDWGAAKLSYLIAHASEQAFFAVAPFATLQIGDVITEDQGDASLALATIFKGLATRPDLPFRRRCPNTPLRIRGPAINGRE
jgi:hypothetical protein